jgi:hypothetical protein
LYLDHHCHPHQEKAQKQHNEYGGTIPQILRTKFQPAIIALLGYLQKTHKQMPPSTLGAFAG